MANVLKYDVNNGSLIDYRQSVHTPDFEGKPGFLINPVIPNFPFKRLKVVGTTVALRSQAELDAIDAEEATATASENTRQTKLANAIAALRGLKDVNAVDLTNAQMKDALRALIVIVVEDLRR